MPTTTPAAEPKLQCRHILTAGHRCASPCLRHEEFCYYHHTTRRPVASPNQRRRRSSTFDLAHPEDRAAIQTSIGEVLRRIAANHIDPRRAGLLLYGLQIASSNLPKTPAASRDTDTDDTPQTVEEITLDPVHGPIAPRAQVPESKRRLSYIAMLNERLGFPETHPVVLSNQTPNEAEPGSEETRPSPHHSQPDILPTLQAAHDFSTAESSIRSYPGKSAVDRLQIGVIGDNRWYAIQTQRVAPMMKPRSLSAAYLPVLLLIVAFAAMPPLSQAAPQHATALQPDDTAPHRTRLILKDGSYQLVMSYRIAGDVVHYLSAERGGAEEEIPAALVDFDATKRWEKQHAQPSPDANPDTQQQPPAIDPELLKEEASRAALTPEVAKDLRLPEQDSTLALDTYRGTPELVPLAQTDSDLNRNTGHNLLRAAINPLSSAHDIVTLKGETSPIQLHVKDPVFYLRIGEETVGDTGGPALTVDTHGASSSAQNSPAGGSPGSRYVLVRADVRTGARVISSFRIPLLGTGQRQEDVVETALEPLPGGHWLKIIPKEPLDFGEFALLEVISDKAVNLGVWDFGVHPVAPDNRDVLKPEPRRPVTLERRGPD